MSGRTPRGFVHADLARHVDEPLGLGGSSAAAWTFGGRSRLDVGIRVAEAQRNRRVAALKVRRPGNPPWPGPGSSAARDSLIPARHRRSIGRPNGRHDTGRPICCTIGAKAGPITAPARCVDNNRSAGVTPVGSGTTAGVPRWTSEQKPPVRMLLQGLPRTLNPRQMPPRWPAGSSPVRCSEAGTFDCG